MVHYQHFECLRGPAVGCCIAPRRTRLVNSRPRCKARRAEKGSEDLSTLSFSRDRLFEEPCGAAIAGPKLTVTSWHVAAKGKYEKFVALST